MSAGRTRLFCWVSFGKVRAGKEGVRMECAREKPDVESQKQRKAVRWTDELLFIWQRHRYRLISALFEFRSNAGLGCYLYEFFLFQRRFRISKNAPSNFTEMTSTNEHRWFHPITPTPSSMPTMMTEFCHALSSH